MLNAIEAAKKSEQWQKDGGQFIPYPGSWLRDKGWEDEYTVDVDESGTSSFDTDEFFEAAVERSRAE
ncbi:MAG TPA: hypothetical protein DD733_07600 [Clostridiales bacterium]|nr:hypothetical protein [Clostridiales bacterium]